MLSGLNLLPILEGYLSEREGGLCETGKSCFALRSGLNWVFGLCNMVLDGA